MTDSGAPSPLGGLLGEFEKKVHLRRLDVIERVRPLRELVSAYQVALEADLARDLASSHALPRPSEARITVNEALAALRNYVDELGRRHGIQAPLGGSPSAGGHPSPARPAAAQSTTRPLGAEAESHASGEGRPAERTLSDALPKIVRATADRKLVIVGALAGRTRALPEPLASATEWVDTGDGGAHAIGNLPTRIKQGRIFGLVICDQAIQHKHSEPLVVSARASGVPVGFAKKGGMGGIARALEAIEEQLAE